MKGALVAKPPTYEGGTGSRSPPAWKYPILWQVVMFFVLFPAFHHLFTPPKTPFFPTGPP